MYLIFWSSVLILVVGVLGAIATGLMYLYEALTKKACRGNYQGQRVRMGVHYDR